MRRTLYLAPLLLLGAVAHAEDDDLGSLLDNIPQIEDKEAEAKKKAEAEAAAAERAADPLAEPSFAEYATKVREHVLSQFKVPGSVAKKAPDTASKVLVKLYSDGTYMGLEPVRMSGDKKFDKAVLKAIQAAEPVPKPPVSLRNDVARGVVVDFSAR